MSLVVLAYDGEFDAAAVIRVIAERQAADVVTVTVDVGQARDIQAARQAALDGGALRAHVFDALDEFARRCVLPALQSAPASVPSLVSTARLAYPVIAARLAEAARLEGTTLVAHGGGESLTAAILDVNPSLTVVAVEIEEGIRCGTAAGARHLLQRPVVDPSSACGVTATVVIEFDEAVPVSINGVTLTLPELMESLSLLGGEHGIGHGDGAPAPGAVMLDAAYRALAARSGVVRIELRDGHQRILSTEERASVLVNHA